MEPFLTKNTKNGTERETFSFERTKGTTFIEGHIIIYYFFRKLKSLKIRSRLVYAETLKIQNKTCQEGLFEILEMGLIQGSSLSCLLFII